MLEKNKKTKNHTIISRPPVVVVLGHIDHGKSTLIEKIKEIKITEKEAGGITQHIGAYEVEHQGKKITFIDTPGHEAFSAIRSRGAKVADIAILVVAVDEGVKSQTKEAISHIKKAGLPIIVALNKIDKPLADINRTQQELAQAGILLESMGGKVPAVKTSALEGKGLEEILDLILLVAEMEELKADISQPAQGVIIEAYLDAQRGPTATLILTNGLLKKGQFITTASTFGRVRSLEDFQGKPLQEALPSQPVVLLGWEKVPKLGEQFKVYPDIESARKAVSQFAEKKIPEKKVPAAVSQPDKPVLNLLIKADVLGSLEAIEKVLSVLPQENIFLRVIKKEVGQINESDIKLAKSSSGYILGFRVKPDIIAQKLAEKQKVKIKTFEVIYELSEYLRGLMEKKVKPQITRTNLGKLKTLIVFRTEKNRQIVGGKIIDGYVKKGVKIEVWRQEEKIGQGRLISLQKNKKDISQAKKGEEVGILYEGDIKIEEGDILLFWTEEKHQVEL